MLLPNAAAVLKGAGMITIRNEEEKDYEKVEKLVRRAFYNVFVPGCFEHYLVHVMRSHVDFLPELDFVLEEDGRIIGNIMYTRARLVDESGREKKVSDTGACLHCSRVSAKRIWPETDKPLAGKSSRARL